MVRIDYYNEIRKIIKNERIFVFQTGPPGPPGKTQYN